MPGNAAEGLPVTSVVHTLLDLAAQTELLLVRKALGRLDYRRELDLVALREACGRGRPGSTALRWSLDHHHPSFGRTNSRLEELFLLLCERFGIPLPETGVWVHGIQVDAIWRDLRLVVELDGRGNHETWGQIKRDRGNELTLRSHGLMVIRYGDAQIRYDAERVATDVIRQRAARAQEAA
jgi:hypothetical protein